MTNEERAEQPFKKGSEIFSNKKLENLETEKRLDLNLEKKEGAFVERSMEKNIEALREVGEKIRDTARDDDATGLGEMDVDKKERGQAIEKIMSSGLEESFLSMTPEKQAEFKRVGEETAKTINDMLDKAKVKVRKVVDLIKRWLSIIPGVNKFFIEQEAKIRADKISNLKK